MINFRIPETANRFEDWIVACHEFIGGNPNVGVHKTSKLPDRANGWYALFVPGGTIRLNYKMRDPGIIWLTSELEYIPHATREERESLKLALNRLANAAGDKWPQPAKAHEVAPAI
jgi:hypothetical protein